MTGTEPRYVVTFRPGTPEMIVVGVLTVVGAGFGTLLALIIRSYDCGEGRNGCSTEGLVQLVIASTGLILALAMLVESSRSRGRPWRWFAAAAIVYAVWVVFTVPAVTG